MMMKYPSYRNGMKIKTIKVYTDENDKVLVANDIESVLEILESNGYIVEVEYEQPTRKEGNDE